MARIILRTALGAAIGVLLYSQAFGNAGFDLGYMLLLLAWGVGMGNSLSFTRSMLSSALNWSANLSIISFFSFGNGIAGFILLMLSLGFVILVGWLYGWVVLIRDIINLRH